MPLTPCSELGTCHHFSALSTRFFVSFTQHSLLYSALGLTSVLSTVFVSALVFNEVIVSLFHRK